MAKWQELTQEFQELTPEERLEELVELSCRLPPISESRLIQPLPESCRVKECQTPVYLWVDVTDDRVHVEAEVSPKSPTVRGLVSLIVAAVDGTTVSEAMSLPDDWSAQLGLTEAVGMTRQHGFRGVIMRIRQEVQSAAQRSGNSPGNLKN